ncbi:MAG: helix-turn-helix domain-containing protein, partial [Actinomycetota bacterium]
MELGPRLRRLRVARGLTQQELAAPHYTHAYVSTI